MKNFKVPLFLSLVILLGFICGVIYLLCNSLFDPDKKRNFNSGSLIETKLFSVDLPFTYGSNDNTDLRFLLLSPSKKYLFYYSPSCLPNSEGCGHYIIDMQEHKAVLLVDRISDTFGWLDNNTIFIGSKDQSQNSTSGISYRIDNLNSILKEEKKNITIGDINVFEEDYIKNNFQVSNVITADNKKKNKEMINSKQKQCSNESSSCFVLTEWANCFLDCYITHDQIDIFVNGKNIGNYKVKPPEAYKTMNIYGNAWIEDDKLLIARIETIFNSKQIIKLGVYKIGK